MKFRRVETRWEDIPADDREKIVVTGWSGYHHLRQGIPVSNEAFHTYILGYAVDPNAIRLPETGGQEITLLQAENLPDYISENEVNIASPSTLIPDLLDSDIREFRYRYRRFPAFREWVVNEGSSEMHAALLERLGDDQEIGHLLEEDFGSERSE